MSNEPTLTAGTGPAELDEQALADVQGGARQYTGGRFQLEIGKYSVGYLRAAAPSQAEEGAPDAVPPAR